MSWRCGSSSDWDLFKQVNFIEKIIILLTYLYCYNVFIRLTDYITLFDKILLLFRAKGYGNAVSIQSIYGQDMNTISFLWENMYWREGDR